jgi:poly-beta-1,6-N-acetyl-D-glucosamine synthase
MTRMSAYALITAARDEAAYITKLLDAVTRQSLLPQHWLIVSDGSIDSTDEIVRDYGREFSFIELARLESGAKLGFSSKASALNIATHRILSGTFDFIGYLDADVSFGTSYIESLLSKFGSDPRLGIAGGFIYEEKGTVFKPRATNSERSVGGAIQMYRRQCLCDVGDFLPMRYGGEDWHAEVRARMAGWKVVAFPELPVYHHRPTASSNGLLKSHYRQGLMDHATGTHPLFEVVKVARRLPCKPMVVGSIVRLTAFSIASLRGDPRPVSQACVHFLRSEQTDRLRHSLKRFFLMT